jgi:hypothetical protein
VVRHCSADRHASQLPRSISFKTLRRATVYGFLSWLCNLDLWQPADVNTATYARFGLAMIDHDTYAALGA